MIYHICKKSEWVLAKTAGSYEPESLLGEGFIHCSTDKQFEQVANFYFKDVPDLVALEIDEERLKAPLKWEAVGENQFPHIYGPLEVHAVVREAELVLGASGTLEFPFKPVLH